MSKRNPFKRVGGGLIFGACLGSLVANSHYGWNMVPLSTPEALSDLSHILIALVGAVLFTIGASDD